MAKRLGNCSLFVSFPSKTPDAKVQKLQAPVSRFEHEGSGAGRGRADFSVKVKSGRASTVRAMRRVVAAAKRAKVAGVRVVAHCATSDGNRVQLRLKKRRK